MNDLITTEEQDLALLDEIDTMPAGMENLESGDVGMPPRLRISQPNRPIEIGGDEAEPGVIVNTMTGEYWQDLEIVPLMFMPKTRIMWPEGYNADNKPMCLSDDGKQPTQERDATDPQPGPCTACPFQQFSDNGEKPRCTMQRNFLVWVVEASEAALLTMQSTGLRAARQLTALAKVQGLRKAIIFTTVIKKNDQGRWYEPVFSRGAALAVDDIIQLAVARDEMKKLVITADTVNETIQVEEKPTVAEVDEIPF